MPIRLLSHALGVISLCLLLVPLAAQASGPEPPEQVDKLFAEYSRKNSPGCALAIIKDGKIVYKKGYGMANLEYAVPVKPDTIFHVASLSKQFTAFAIHLLAADGKLSLDDDIRKYLPELHDFGTTITIRHLLHHTSGLRDQWALLNMAGWRSGDIITEDDILRLVWRQQELNFPPGAEYLYSNTGYTLLAVIVQRVSGKSFREFCHERIFQPLGMNRTHFHDDNAEVVPGRSYSYYSGDAGVFHNDPLQYANVGATSLFTTVEDMALWDRNFSKTTVGSDAIVTAMLEKGKLSSGKEIDYASGLVHGDYRGLPVIEHSGADAGFRSDYLRFPDQRFSVILFSNLASMDTVALARKIADIYIADRLQPPAGTRASLSNEFKIDHRLYDSYCGEYLLPPDLIFHFSRDGEQLWVEPTGHGKMEIFAASDTEFFFKGIDARLRFLPHEENPLTQVVLKDGDTERTGSRIVPAAPGPDQLSTYLGQYYSPELEVIYTLFLREGHLMLRYPRGEVTLAPTQDDTFVGGYPVGSIHFLRSDEKAIRGFKITNGRVRNLAFEKTSLPHP